VAWGSRPGSERSSVIIPARERSVTSTTETKALWQEHSASISALSRSVDLDLKVGSRVGSLSAQEANYSQLQIVELISP
jgi:hypothetical protein